MSDGQRSRGRGRSQSQRRPEEHGSARGHPESAPQGAWARRPGVPPGQPGPSFQQTPYSRTPQQSVGRAPQRYGGSGDAGPGSSGGKGSAPMEVQRTVGAGGAAGGPSGEAGPVGRGGLRGRRSIITEVVTTRPQELVKKTGETGSPVTLQANYFKLLATTNWCIHQYRVDFAPDEDRTVVRKGLLRLHKEILGSYIFDGTVLYSSNRYPENLEFVSKRQSDDTNIKITVRQVGELMKGDHHYIQFFNIIMRKCLGLLNLQLVGRDYYDAKAKVEVHQYRLELWPGYLTSIRQHERDILMCSEISHKVMRQETLLDILNDAYNNKRDSNWKDDYGNQVRGLIVLTDYNNNTYRIEDVDFNVSPSSTFQLKNGEQISYKDYYFNKYQIRIRNERQPMLLTKKKEKDRRAEQDNFVYLVPELCRATGLTDNMRSNFQLMRALSQYTRVAPDARMNKLMAFNRRLRSEPKIVEEFTHWNLKLDERLIEIPGRVLPPETIVLGRGRTVSAEMNADWTKSLFNNQAFTAAKLDQWVVICTDRARAATERFIQTVMDSAAPMGCIMSRPRYFSIRDDRAGTYTDALETIMSSATPQMIFCVVSNNQAGRYNAIKKKCIVDRPVLTQVVVERNLSSKGMRTIATKVAIQLNSKLGGAPWSINLPNINLMVIGFDVCHDAEHRGEYGAMVASLDKALTRYFSAVSAHTSGEELSNEFSVNAIKALQRYKDLNGTLPTHIVVYRDGVGEGQIPQVFNHEVKHFKIKLRDIYGDAPIKMAFIIVTKRLNTKFFHRGRNPQPGTVIDDVVTDPLKYDFFIVSQSVREGTVSPTAYSVIADTLGWKPDQVQRMTYKLTHMYYNVSATMRVPAPCQYAHKLAFLVSQSIHRPPSTQMETLLYYL